VPRGRRVGDGEGKIKEAAHLRAKPRAGLAFWRAVEETRALLGGKCPYKTMHLTAHSYPITERGSPSMNTHDDDLRSIRNRGARYIGARSAKPESLEVQPLVLLAAAASPPCDDDQGPDRTADTMPDASIRSDASSSRRASCVPAGRGQQGPQSRFAISSAML